ncbi:MAG TPA: ubiquitin-like domain-containing protein [Bacillota bacterium]|nr:ubiquitin-like domain-containing protein [Bacillota bacterium]
MNLKSKRMPTLMKKFVLPFVGVLALVAFTTLFILEAKSATVTVSIDGDEQEVDTRAHTVGELLEDLDVEVGENDYLSMDLDEELTNGATIKYEKANNVYITIDGETDTYQTTKKTLADFFSESDIEVTKNDHVSHEFDQEIFDTLHVVIHKAFEVTVDDGGKKETVWTTRARVKDLLEEQNIELPKKDDKIKPKLNKQLTKEGTIKITRVEKETETVEEAIAFDTETKNDSSLERGKKKTVSEGKEGKKVKEYEIIYENGKVVERKLIGENIEKQPKNKVVAIGTKKKQPKNLVQVSSSNKSSGQPNGKTYRMSATAYTADCAGCSGVTSTGINLKKNRNAKVIAVDPSIIPLGSKVWVEGYGYAIAGDTGGSIKGNRIDVHVPSQSAAYRFGRKTVKVVIVD